MTAEEVRTQFPYPVASVYADLDDPQAGPQRRREALYFTCYQLMRTVGLTLVGQYLTREPPADAPREARRKLNAAIAGLRSPFFSNWIELLHALGRRREALHLDFFPEFASALKAANEARVTVPLEYALDHGLRRELNWLDAFLGLRNGCAHAGMGRDDACREAVALYRPWLDALLSAFGFLARYDLLVLHSGVDDEPTLVRTLRGDCPPDPVRGVRDLPGGLLLAGGPRAAAVPALPRPPRRRAVALL